MSIGIIGGADGPTSILIAGPDAGWLIAAAIALLAVVGIWIFLRKRRKG